MLKIFIFLITISLLGCGGGGSDSSSSSDSSYSVTVSSYDSSMKEKSTQKITVTDSNGNDVSSNASWLSSNESIITVSSAGLITGIRSGKSYVQAKYSSGSYEFSETILITVVALNYTEFKITLSSDSEVQKRFIAKGRSLETINMTVFSSFDTFSLNISVDF